MIISAKFASVCPLCSKSITVGSKVEWERGEKAKHTDCGTIATATTTASIPAATEQTVTRAITVERTGRRSYLKGDTYAVRGMLRDAGCHWDAATKSWWIGDDKRAQELAAKASTMPAEAASEPAARAPFARRFSSRFGSGHGSAASVSGYSSYCTDNASCQCYDCAS